MADDQYLDLMRQGAAAWNAWRREHPGVVPDLSQLPLDPQSLPGLVDAESGRVDLRDLDLSNCQLTLVRMQDLDLSGATLSGANLRRARLKRIDLSGAVLASATLANAMLDHVTLADADLTEAVLHEAGPLVVFAGAATGFYLAMGVVIL